MWSCFIGKIWDLKMLEREFSALKLKFKKKRKEKAVPPDWEEVYIDQIRRYETLTERETQRNITDIERKSLNK